MINWVIGGIIMLATLFIIIKKINKIKKGENGCEGCNAIHCECGSKRSAVKRSC